MNLQAPKNREIYGQIFPAAYSVEPRDYTRCDERFVEEISNGNSSSDSSTIFPGRGYRQLAHLLACRLVRIRLRLPRRRLRRLLVEDEVGGMLLTDKLYNMQAGRL